MKNNNRDGRNIIANRGLHIFCAENSITAFKYALKAKLAVRIDIRRTKDNKLICFHDRYTLRLLGIPGKVSVIKYDKLKRFNIAKTTDKIPLLNNVLKMVSGAVPVYLMLKGHITKKYLVELEKVLKGYNGKIYIETKNIIALYILKKKYKCSSKVKIYYSLNPFRTRPETIRTKDYGFQCNKYYGLSKNVLNKIPTVKDISSIIVRNMEELESKKEILATIGRVINRYETRIGDNHWVKKSLWLHRSIVSERYPEHSKESFEECIRFANKHNINLTLEFDVVMYKNMVKCYHEDKISSILGQDSSCAKKLDIEKTISLKEILELVSKHPNINLAIDIKDYHIKNRALERQIIHEIENSNFKGNFILMSFNPTVLNYFKKVRPNWLRAQVSHSLRGLVKRFALYRFPWVVSGVLGALFDSSQADCVVMDNSDWLYYLISFHRNVQGKPVLIYAPKSYVEQEAFVGRDSVANFIVENISSSEAWSRSYIEKFKI